MKNNKIIKRLSIIFLLGIILGVPGAIDCHQSHVVADKPHILPPKLMTARLSLKNLYGPPQLEKGANEYKRPVTKDPQKLKHKKPAEPSYDQIIHKVARLYQVDPALIKAIIMAESRFKPKAVSKRGAKGLMQLMPVTAKSLGVTDSFNPEDNITGGVMYFRKLLDRFDGDVKLALAAYNAGSRYIRKYGGVPPFRQTRTYIHKVFKYHQMYKKEETKPDKVV